MSKKVTTQSPKLYIGIDIHKKTWKVHFCTDITEGSSKSMPPDAEGLFKYVNRLYEDHEVTAAYESGCCGYSAARSFIEFGWDTFVVNPADIPRPAKQSIVKTDKVDAKNIAKQLRAGNLRKIPIPDVERECLRSLTRHRQSLVKDMRRIKCRIKGALLFFGVEVPEEFDNPNWSKAFLAWLTEIEWNYSSAQYTFESQLAQFSFVHEQILRVSNQIRAYCRKHHKKDYNLLRSVPGIGELTAANIISELGDIRLFSSFKKLASYVGIVPGIYSSADTYISTGSTPRANKIVRSLIVEASWVAMRIDPVFEKYYRSHAGKDSKAVIFKVAHKLLSRIHAVMKHNTPYQIGLVK